MTALTAGTSPEPSEIIEQLQSVLQRITNLNADTHTAVLRTEMEYEERVQAERQEVVIDGSLLNCETFTLPPAVDEEDGAQEEYRLPKEETEIGKVMRDLLRNMRQKRDRNNCVTLQEKRDSSYDEETCDGSCIRVTQEKDAEYLHELVSRNALDGRSTDTIIDRILWGLTNVATKEQIEIMLEQFTKQRYIARSKKMERKIKAALETGKHFRAHDRSHVNALFDCDVMGEDLSPNSKDLADLILSACATLGLSCDKPEAELVTKCLEHAYTMGHAGRSRRQESVDGQRRSRRNQDIEEDDSADNTGGCATAGKNNKYYICLVAVK